MDTISLEYASSFTFNTRAWHGTDELLSRSCARARACVCVCVCVCERERERERVSERERERERETHTHTHTHTQRKRGEGGGGANRLVVRRFLYCLSFHVRSKIIFSSPKFPFSVDQAFY